MQLNLPRCAAFQSLDADSLFAGEAGTSIISPRGYVLYDVRAVKNSLLQRCASSSGLPYEGPLVVARMSALVTQDLRGVLRLGRCHRQLLPGLSTHASGAGWHQDTPTQQTA